MEPVVISVKAAKDALGLGMTRTYQLINDGSLETVKLGRRRLVKVASIKALVESGVAPRLAA